jgi:hypothetical protein
MGKVAATAGKERVPHSAAHGPVGQSFWCSSSPDSPSGTPTIPVDGRFRDAEAAPPIAPSDVVGVPLTAEAEIFVGRAAVGGRIEQLIHDRARTAAAALRHLIQHRPRFKVMLAGSHALDDLDRWVSYLINVQVAPMGRLSEREARRLIERPIVDFPLRYEFVDIRVEFVRRWFAQ